MKKVFYIFIVFYIFLSVTIVNAAECSYKELKELKELAKKIEIGYYPGISDENFGYIHTDLYNLNNKFYIVSQGDEQISYTKPVIKLGDFNPGIKLKVIIYASNKTNCEDEKLYTLYEDLPNVNGYYTRSECNGNETKKVCRKLIDTSNLSEEEFISRTKSQSKESSSLLKIFDFIKQNIIYIVAILIIIVIIVIVIIRKNKKKVKVEI